MIHGNLEGIRESALNDLEKLYDAEFERDVYLPDRLLNVLVHYTEQINREMLVYLGRDGSVLEIAMMAGLLIVCTAYLVDGSFSPFLYFRF